jgi:hypothetical protein
MHRTSWHGMPEEALSMRLLAGSPPFVPRTRAEMETAERSLPFPFEREGDLGGGAFHFADSCPAPAGIRCKEQDVTPAEPWPPQARANSWPTMPLSS